MVDQTFSPLTKENIVARAIGRYSVNQEPGSGKRASRRLKSASKSELKTMDAMVIGAAVVGSMATAFVVQRAVLGVMFRAMLRNKPTRQ